MSEASNENVTITYAQLQELVNAASGAIVLRVLDEQEVPQPTGQFFGVLSGDVFPAVTPHLTPENGWQRKSIARADLASFFKQRNRRLRFDNETGRDKTKS